MRAALYARVSFEEQVRGGLFGALVGSRGWTVYREYIEEGISARTDNISRRPAFIDKLSKAVVTFLSINEQMGCSTLWENLAFTLRGGLAQFYSDISAKRPRRMA